MVGAPAGDVKNTLEASHVHEQWERAYRSPENERFYEQAFDEVSRFLGTPDDEHPVLDLGCGPGFHAIRLARRGYRVTAVDFSPAVLALAQENVQRAGLADRISFQAADLTSLPLSNASWTRVLCWGVLMHIPDVQAALDEIARVLAPEGLLVISEGNAAAPENVLLNVVRRARGRSVRWTKDGIHVWKQTDEGPLLIRTVRISWLIRGLRQRSVVETDRRACQFSEAYTKLPPRLAKAVHSWNMSYFRHRGPALLAEGNMLLLRKQPSGAKPALNQ